MRHPSSRRAVRALGAAITRWAASLGTCVGLIALATSAQAATLNVANDGTDGLLCGAATSPCRSISQAIANAAPGSIIKVGPGLYGDLDGDGLFTLPGEEAAEVDTGCDCVIKIDKKITLQSTEGAGGTLIHGGGAAVDAVMYVEAEDVVVGKPRRGFTFTGAPTGFGLYFLEGVANGGKVEGNLSTGNFQGFGGGLVTFNRNWAVSNAGRGFYVNGNESGGKVTNNVALATTSGEGFALLDVLTAKGNLAIGNRNGFLMEVQDTYTLNFTANSAIGNFENGVLVAASSTLSAGSTIGGSNLFGEGLVSALRHGCTCRLFHEPARALPALQDESIHGRHRLSWLAASGSAWRSHAVGSRVFSTPGRSAREPNSAVHLKGRTMNLAGQLKWATPAASSLLKRS